MKRSFANRRSLAVGALGGVLGVVLCRWGGYYLPETDSFVGLRDLPGILLALFVGPVPALVAGTLAALGRALIGIFGGIGGTTWVGSSLATLVATLVAVAARRWIFRGGRPSFALGAAVAAAAEMMHMGTVLLVGFADFSAAFAVIAHAIPFQCGGTAAVVAAVSLLANRRQDGRENVAVSAVVTALVGFVTLLHLALDHAAADFAAGRLPMTHDLYHFPCNFATVLFGIVLSDLVLAFAVYARRRAANREEDARPEGGRTGGVRIGIRGKFAISIVALLGVIGCVIGMTVSVGIRVQFGRGCAELALGSAQRIARMIDGARIPDYCKTGRKDAHYKEVQLLLDNIEQGSSIDYLYVMVPDGDEVVYVWDAGEESALGEREKLDAHVGPMLAAVIDGKLKYASFVHRGEKYGCLMTAAAPILGADGVPVALVGVDLSMKFVDEQIDRVGLTVALVTLGLVLFCLAGFYLFVSRFVVSPAEQQIRAEKERIHAELNVARRIQADALPNVFPAFPDRPEFDIYAMMDPAKEVGGDFYDFFFVDEMHLALVIGDVSDKGVPAALFMMTTKTLVRARTRQGGTPAEILRDVNAQLCEGNGSGMFVTLYLAVVDLATGRGLAANAGHADPALRRAGGGFELVRYRHDRMLAMWPGLDFTDRAFELRPGDTLLVYTDGVTESATADRTFYGANRLTAFLNGCRDLGLEPLVKALRADVAAFADGAPQSDDITILAVTYNGSSSACGIDLV